MRLQFSVNSFQKAAVKTISPIKPQSSLTDQAFHKLAEAISRGDFEPGQAISEVQIAKQLGISRGPLREAMNRLEARNLVERRPRFGVQVVRLSQKDLAELFTMREALEGLACRLAATSMSDQEIAALSALLEEHGRSKGVRTGSDYYQGSANEDFHFRIVRGSGNTPESIRAFLQQSVNSAFSGVFRQPGDFSVRSFVRQRQGRALFVEYDIATGSRLTPVYRVLIDLAIKEALTQGRGRQPGSVYFVMDEFSLVPLLQHLSDGINFGRSLGLKFIVGTQNVEQVLFAYGLELGRTIMSGFGTVFAFRLMDDVSRELVRQRFGANRKQITIQAAVRAQGVRQETVLGNVVEDWVMSALTVGQCIASLPVDAPFSFAFNTFRR